VGGAAILVVEDEADLADLLRYNLERAGYSCRCVADGKTALEEILRRPPDLVILDRMLPRMSGDEVIRGLRADPRCQNVPVIMLTAKAGEAEQLAGFSLGADDYVTKPFSMNLLLARVQAMLRRTAPDGSDRVTLTGGPIVLERDRHEVRVGGAPVVLTSTEFRLLETLLVANERVLTREQLIDAAIGPGVAVTDRTIDVHVTALRRKLGTASGWIQTVRGVGYVFRSHR